MAKQNVDNDVKKIKRFLDALQKKKKKPQEESPPQDRFSQLVNQYRQKAADEERQEDIIAKNMLYSKAAGAHPAVGVVPAGLLGFKDPHPEQGQPMGVDVSQMSPEDRQRVLSRLSLEDQEKLARKWSERMKGGNI